MRRMFLMSSVLLAAPFYAGTAGAEVCIAEEDCNNLGYTEDKSCTDGLKCPFGEKWHCPDKKCQIGWILNSDMSCTENVESGKTPIAVVVYMDDNGNGQAMTASPTETYIQWGGYGRDISSLMNYKIYTEAIKDFTSCDNTQKIILTGNSSQYPAAWAAKNYTPSKAPATKGKWCLPAPGILNSLYINLSVINNTISKLRGTQLKNNNEYIWSSSEFDSENAWRFCTENCNTNGGIGADYKSTTDYGNTIYTVRPVIEFNIDTGAAECKKTS